MFKKKSVTAVSLGLRTLVGGYLLYLAYSLLPAIQNSPNSTEKFFWIGVVVLFSGIGIVVAGFSIKAFLKGEYDKGTESSESDKKEDDETKSGE
jgi:hypothetical protein